MAFQCGAGEGGAGPGRRVLEWARGVACDGEVPDLGRGEAGASWGGFRLVVYLVGLPLPGGARLEWGVVGWGVVVRGGQGGAAAGAL